MKKTEPEPTTYFAVQIAPRETAHSIAALILKMAREAPVLFRQLETLDVFEVGAVTYMRVRADMINPFPIIDRLYLAGRSVIYPSPGAYRVRRSGGGREGCVSLTLMHSVPMVAHHHKFQGPRETRLS